MVPGLLKIYQFLLVILNFLICKIGELRQIIYLSNFGIL